MTKQETSLLFFLSQNGYKLLYLYTYVGDFTNWPFPVEKLQYFYKTSSIKSSLTFVIFLSGNCKVLRIFCFFFFIKKVLMLMLSAALLAFFLVPCIYAETYIRNAIAVFTHVLWVHLHVVAYNEFIFVCTFLHVYVCACGCTFYYFCVGSKPYLFQ